jgi:hypothetical protein
MRFPSALAINGLLTGLFLPNLVGWCVFACLVEPDLPARLAASGLDGFEGPPSSIQTPNPQRAPAYFLGPMEAVVYVNPYWAALGWFWYVPGLAAFAGAVVWTTRREPPLGKVAASALAAGTLLAAPWIYAIAHLLAH